MIETWPWYTCSGVGNHRLSIETASRRGYQSKSRWERASGDTPGAGGGTRSRSETPGCGSQPTAARDCNSAFAPLIESSIDVGGGSVDPLLSGFPREPPLPDNPGTGPSMRTTSTFDSVVEEVGMWSSLGPDLR